MSIDTLKSLHDRVTRSVALHRQTSRTLEEYLRAVRGILQEASMLPSYDSFAQILSSAFVIEPADFDSAWLSVTAPPNLEECTGIESVDQQLSFLISDVRRMQEAGILDAQPMKLYGGVDSPTGHRWFNFHPFSFVECALRGALDIAGADAEVEILEPDWSELASILDLGRIYE